MLRTMAVMALAALLLCGCFVMVRGGGYHGRGSVAVRVTGPRLHARPRLVYIPEASMYYAPDVSGDLFFYGSSWYWYTSGSWYVSGTYSGPWSVVSSVPGTFYRIPSGHPKYYVVRGRRERHAPGRPSWSPLRAKPRLVYIPEAGIYYAGDLTLDLFLYGSTWYWCSGGVWRSANHHNGPWVVISATPSVFHRIPKSHPRHRVIRSHKSHKSPVKKMREKSAPAATPAATPSRHKSGSPVRKLRGKSVPATPATPATPASKLRGKGPATPATPATPASVKKEKERKEKEEKEKREREKREKEEKKRHERKKR